MIQDYPNSVFSLLKKEIKKYDKEADINIDESIVLNEDLTFVKIFINLPIHQTVVDLVYSTSGLIRTEVLIIGVVFRKLPKTLSSEKERRIKQIRELSLLSQCEKFIKEVPFISNMDLKKHIVEKYITGDFNHRTKILLEKEDQTLTPFKFIVESEKSKKSYMMVKSRTNPTELSFTKDVI